MSEPQSVVTMDETAQRIAIAIAVGWKPCRIENLFEHPTKPEVYALCPDEGYRNHLPDYLNSLDAMAEAEKVLDGDMMDAGSLRYTYARYVYQVAAGENQPFRATAKERAEAFLRTLNLWK